MKKSPRGNNRKNVNDTMNSSNDDSNTPIMAKIK